MTETHLWTEAYQGEVLGEAFFAALAEREEDAERRQQLEVLCCMERATKELAEPVLERRGIDRGDTAATLAAVPAMVEGVGPMAWEDFLGSFQPVISQFLAKYRELEAQASDEEERQVASAYVAHELALEAFIRRALDEQGGDPLEPVLALPHVAPPAATPGRST
ncbi:MAG TPA: hypothetical protein VK277_10520 [Acidimicrobiales bacterium]|nr:hypothetical protein [Acidimicrobiales bacterium]